MGIGLTAYLADILAMTCGEQCASQKGEGEGSEKFERRDGNHVNSGKRK